MTASGARRADASGTCQRPEPSARPARAGLPDPFRFLSAARLPRLGLRGGLAAALVLLALAALVPAGPAQAQVAKVTGVTVTYASSTSLKVTWNPAAGACDYQLQWKSDQQSYTNTERDVSIFGGGGCSPATTYTITGLTFGTRYTVRVSGFADESGPWSDDATALLFNQKVILTPLPEGHKLLVRWLAVPGTNLYSVAAFLGAIELETEDVSPPDTSHTFDLTPGTAYRIRVQARDSNANTIVSAEATAAPFLLPVTGLSIGPAEVAGQTSGTVLKATWDAVLNAEYYAMQLKTADGEWPNSEDRRNNTSHIITGLTADTLYAVRVRAVDATGGSTSVWTTGYAVPNSLAPTNLAVSSGGAGSVTLTWSAPTATGKTVERYYTEYWSGSELGPGDFDIQAFVHTLTTGTVTDLRPQTEYTFRMYAEFEDGTRSPTSNTVTYTTTAPTSAPVTPGTPLATAESWDTVSVRWVPEVEQGVTGYNVEFQTPNTNGPWKAVPVVGDHDVTKSTLTVYGHGGLEPSTWYRYRVRAVNGVGRSHWSTSPAVYTHSKPFGFDYDITERYGADGLEVPGTKTIGHATRIPARVGLFPARHGAFVQFRAARPALRGGFGQPAQTRLRNARPWTGRTGSARTSRCSCTG